ncbi:MAG: pyridoxal-dependent decarboxylase, partial [Rhodospirillales bacterium]
CTAHFVRDPEALVKTLSINPTYLLSREGEGVIDYRDWSVPLGRRFRALKLWFVIRSYGVDGLKAIIRNHIELAKWLEEQIACERDFELMAPRQLSLINFRYVPKDAEDLDGLNSRLLNAVNDDGLTYLTQNVIGGVYAIRFQIGQTMTQQEHVDAAWQRIRSISKKIR